MKRTIALLILALGSTPLWAMPSQITFQGTLKEHGVPVNIPKNMQFSFVDSSGVNIPGTAPLLISNVQVTNGLFAVQLPIDPSIPWEQYTPYIQVSVEGQILSPNQPLNANLYAASAIPQGLIAMFDGPCPTGWTSFAPLNDQGLFPKGGDTYGATGGSATHVHTGRTNQASADYITFDSGSSNPASHPAHTHTFTTDPASSLPPYLTMVFCKKL